MIKNVASADDWRWINNFKSSKAVTKIETGTGETLDLKYSNLAIVGKNGSRKTQLLRSIHTKLHTEESNRSGFRMKSSVFEHMKLSSSRGEKLVSLFFDPCSLIPALEDRLNADANTDDFLEAYGSSCLDQEGLEWLSYLTGNIYTKVEVCTVEEGYDDFPTFPIFNIERSSICYSSKGTGYGEHSLLYTYWLMALAEQISKEGRGVVLLMEEPESFISPFFQKRMMNFVAFKAKRIKAQLIVVSHSEHIVEKFDIDRLIAVRWDTQSSLFRFEAMMNGRNLANELGITKRYHQIAVVEDVCAQIFLQELLSSQDTGLHDDVLVIPTTSGESSITKVSQHLTKPGNGFKIKYVYDGDFSEAEIGVIKLPLKSPPERLVKEWFSMLQADKQGKLLGIDKHRVAAILDRHSGANHHDFLRHIAHDVELDYHSMFRSLCRGWTRDDLNQNLLSTFIESFNSTETVPTH